LPKIPSSESNSNIIFDKINFASPSINSVLPEDDDKPNICDLDNFQLDKWANKPETS
jgi:hypothetical protein